MCCLLSISFKTEMHVGSVVLYLRTSTARILPSSDVRNNLSMNLPNTNLCGDIRPNMLQWTLFYPGLENKYYRLLKTGNEDLRNAVE